MYGAPFGPASVGLVYWMEEVVCDEVGIIAVSWLSSCLSLLVRAALESSSWVWSLFFTLMDQLLLYLNSVSMSCIIWSGRCMIVKSNWIMNNFIVGLGGPGVPHFRRTDLVQDSRISRRIISGQIDRTSIFHGPYSCAGFAHRGVECFLGWRGSDAFQDE